jgi:hypothetical protein
VASAAGTPQGPQAVTFLVTCPGLAPFEITAPNLNGAAGVGSTMGVIAVGALQGNMPTDRYMICTGVNEATGQTVTAPILIAPTKH